MTYSWQNEDGEPIMSGEAWRFEQQLDMDARDDYYADHFYDDYDEPEFEDGECCEQGDANFSTERQQWECAYCREPVDVNEPDEPEDRWLDSYMEDRISSMYE